MKKIVFLFFIFLSVNSFANSCSRFILGDHPQYPLNLNDQDYQNFVQLITNEYKSNCQAYGGRISVEPRINNYPVYVCGLDCTPCPSGTKPSSNPDFRGMPIFGCEPISSSSSSSSDCTLTESCSSSSQSSLPFCSQVEAPAMCQPDPASSAASTSSGASSSASSSLVSSSASSATGSTGSASSNRDQAPTSSSELCELNFGVGNCTAVAHSSPCSNSYTVNGQKFCISQSNSNSSGSSSLGSSGSGGSSSPSVTATANNCTTQPTCTGGDPIQCAILRQSWLNFCDGADNQVEINADSDNANIDDEVKRIFRENAAVLNADNTVKGVGSEIKLGDNAALIDQLNSYASGASSGSCPSPRPIRLSIGTFELSYQIFCDLSSSISNLVLLSFTIFGSLIIYRTLERA